MKWVVKDIPATFTSFLSTLQWLSSLTGPGCRCGSRLLARCSVSMPSASFGPSLTSPSSFLSLLPLLQRLRHTNEPWASVGWMWGSTSSAQAPGNRPREWLMRRLTDRKWATLCGIRFLSGLTAPCQVPSPQGEGEDGRDVLAHLSEGRSNG